MCFRNEPIQQYRVALLNSDKVLDGINSLVYFFTLPLRT